MIRCEFEDGKKVSLRHVTVDCLIVKDNRLLMTRRADFLLHGGKLCLPGGFLDRDETVTEGLRREVREETGYEIQNLTLFRINDNPFRKSEDRQNISFVFLAESGEKVSEPDQEVKELVWIDLSNLPKEEEVAFDHFEDIEFYLQFLKEKFPLPILKQP